MSYARTMNNDIRTIKQEANRQSNSDFMLNNKKTLSLSIFSSSVRLFASIVVNHSAQSSMISWEIWIATENNCTYIHIIGSCQTIEMMDIFDGWKLRNQTQFRFAYGKVNYLFAWKKSDRFDNKTTSPISNTFCSSHW